MRSNPHEIQKGLTYSHQLYAPLESWLGAFERRVPFRERSVDEAAADAGHACDIILFGLGRYGWEIGARLIARGYRVLGVDFDPEVVAAWRAAGRDGLFGDATDPEFMGHLPLRRARAVISAVPRTAASLTDADPRLALLHGLRSQGFRGRIAVAMHTETDVETLRREGVDVVLTPFSDAADFAVTSLEEALATVKA